MLKHPVPQQRVGQGGLSLLELMIALTLSAFLMIGVTQTFLSNLQSNRVQNSYSRVQESGRLSLELLQRDIRMADFWGCLNKNATYAIENHLDTGDADYSPDVYNQFNESGLAGADNVAAGALAMDGATVITTGTDTITLTSGRGNNSIEIEAPYMVTNAAALHVNANSGIQQGDVLMITDCSLQADVFEVSNANPDSGTVDHNTGVANPIGNATKDFSHTYGPDASILKPTSVQYFLATGQNGSRSSLFRSTDGATAIELVPNVEDMQILYGEDRDADGFVERYSEADAAGILMDKVKTVRMQLLIAGAEDLDFSGALTFNGAAVTADGRLRRVYSSTVAIRNRTL